MKTIKILLFDDIELLDFAGPLEVFSVVHYLKPELGVNVSTLAFKDEIVVDKSKLTVKPNETSFDGDIDLLIIPGGFGTRPIVDDAIQLEKINKFIKQSKIVATVCTGALIIAKLGYLKGLSATTHHMGKARLKELEPTVIIDDTKRFIDNDTILTSAGISAGIDMSLHLVEKHFGYDMMNNTRNYMEYENSSTQIAH